MKSAKALTLTYLTPVSFASLNGSDKEADNMSNIKKVCSPFSCFHFRGKHVIYSLIIFLVIHNNTF